MPVFSQKGGRDMENIFNNLIINLYQSGYLNKIIAIIVILVITSFVSKKANNIIKEKLEETNLKWVNIQIINGITKYGLWVISLVLILKVIGLNDLSLILGTAVSAVSGFIIVKLIYGVIDNVIAGVLLVSLDRIKVGQKIKVKDIEGTVVNIGLRKTKIKDSNNIVYLVPNQILDDEVLIINN